MEETKMSSEEDRIELFRKLRDVSVSVDIPACAEDDDCGECPFNLEGKCVLEHLQTHNV